MQPDVLIQNVSSQCIPNLVAIRTFRPRKVVWVCTSERRSALKHLQRVTRRDVADQQVWHIDARDAEKLHVTLLKNFPSLSRHQRVVYHLTGGTKSMALQGLYNLGIFRREFDVEVQGVVMDPRSQCFDVVYPRPLNNVYPCAELTLTEMITVHNNQWDDKHRHTSPTDCSKNRELWEAVRLQAPALKRVWKSNDMRAQHYRPPSNQKRHFSYENNKVPKNFPSEFRACLHLLQDAGLLTKLAFPNACEVEYEQGSEDIIKILNGVWLECWLGAVLHDSGIKWNESYVSATVLEGDGGKQEFDFLGATNRNRLVYWSCKTDVKLSNDKLFEVDALRDGIAGADFHIAGLLHTGVMTPTMQAKARRMNIHAVNAFDRGAEEEVIRVSEG